MTGDGMALRTGCDAGVVVVGVAPAACYVAYRTGGRVVARGRTMADGAIAKVVEHGVVFPTIRVVAGAASIASVCMRRIMAGGAIAIFSRMLKIDPGPVGRAVAFGALTNIVRHGFFVQVAL